MYQMHRVFCATPWELEAERFEFYAIIGRFNEALAMARGILFVPVSVIATQDKRRLQYDIDENVRQCSYFILLLEDSWGPVERTFQRDYRLALQLMEAPDAPMTAVACLQKNQSPVPQQFEGMSSPDGVFATVSEFDAKLTGILSRWLDQMA